MHIKKLIDKKIGNLPTKIRQGRNRKELES